MIHFVTKICGAVMHLWKAVCPLARNAPRLNAVWSTVSCINELAQTGKNANKCAELARSLPIVCHGIPNGAPLSSSYQQIKGLNNYNIHVYRRGVIIIIDY
jgi:hypothetical protein